MFQPLHQKGRHGAERWVLIKGTLSCCDHRSNEPPAPKTLLTVYFGATQLTSNLLKFSVGISVVASNRKQCQLMKANKQRVQSTWSSSQN